MPAPLSLVIPTLNAEAELGATLRALMEGVEAGVIRELVISDGGSDDATGQVAEAVGAVLVTGAAGRGGQLRRGAAVAKGDWLLFLHADTHLAPGWSAAVAAAMTDPTRAGYGRLAFRAAGLAPRVVAGWANFRSKLFGLPYGDQGLLIARPLYDRIGGYPDLPLMEDVAMARALRGHLRALPIVAMTSAARYHQHGWFRTGYRNLWRLGRYVAGADPAALAREYRR